MALERVGLGGVLTFDETQAVRATGRARDEFGRFVKEADKIPPTMNRVGVSMSRVARQIGQGVRQIGAGVNQMAGGLRNAGFAMLPLTAAVGGGIAVAANFEQQMDAVGSIARADAEDMQRLTDYAQKMGIESVFSAQQAGEAMEYMARSGATTDEIIGGLQGVMNTAAAETIDLATASDIVAQTTRIMGREWGQASNTADILALTSASTNTDVISLGEAMRYGGQAARSAGLDLEETAGIMGQLAEAGLRGSTGGTALTNALNKLADPSSAAQDHLKELGIQMTTTASGGIDIVNVSQQISNALEGIQDPYRRTAIATEIFGIRGRRAYEALAAKGEESTTRLIDSLRHASDEEGFSAQAAARRLDNLKGAITLFMSSLEAAAITLFGPMLGPLKEAVQGITENLNTILFGVQAIMGAGDDAEKRFEAMNQVFEDGGENTLNVVMGVVDAIDVMREAFAYVVDVVKSFRSDMNETFGGDTVRQITKLAILFGLAAAAIAPILVAIGAIAFVITTVIIPIISGLGTVISAVFGPVLLIPLILGAAFLVIRNEGESVGQTLMRIWENVKAAAMSVWTGAIQPLWQGIQSALVPAFAHLSEVWDATVQSIKGTIAEIVALFSDSTSDIEVDWQEVGMVIGAVIATIAETFLTVVQFIVPLIGELIKWVVQFGENLYAMFIAPFDFIKKQAQDVASGLALIFSGNILEGLKHLGQAILDFILEPIKLVLRGVTTLADAFGAGDLIGTSVREFARAAAPQVQGPTVQGTRGLAGAGAAQPPSAARAELEGLGGQVGAAAAGRAARANAPTTLQADITVPEQEVNVENRVCVDGREVSRATSRHRQEIGERSGFKTTPFQRRIRVEQGATPA